MTFLELTKHLRDSNKARFDATADALYYCNHSKQSARLKRRLEHQLALVRVYDDMLARLTKEASE